MVSALRFVYFLTLFAIYTQHKNNDTHQTIDYYDSTKLKNVFAKHQDDGFVNGEDLKVIMFEVGRHLTDNEIMILSMVGKFDFESFQRLVNRSDHVRRSIIQLFQKLDKDKDGVVSTTDLRLALSYGSDIHFSYDDIISIVRKLSNSDNGYVTFQDFDKFMDST
uniref:Uncharacterized LOC100186011 n=1 Tax=Ciona intestinalis TaxID=7719 RepID=H2XRL4_CIOIN|nr:uncharacterized protein LOC100186011 isoform X1 [Ciona intestinalis]|eukprot:XP_004225869.1 uncharacterized protein LOC100186011 isoform X1 [Ciona intestinalis]